MAHTPDFQLSNASILAKPHGHIFSFISYGACSQKMRLIKVAISGVTQNSPFSYFEGTLPKEYNCLMFYLFKWFCFFFCMHHFFFLRFYRCVFVINHILYS